MNDNCKELLNIKYKNMLLNPNNNIFNNDKKEKSQNLDDFLNTTTDNVKVKSWSQLNKMEKIQKLEIYVEKISNDYELDTKDKEDLKIYLKQCLNRKQLQRIKDVVYDKKDGIIKKINGLQIKKGKLGEKEKRFTLKNIDKKDSTLKNLGSGKQKRNKLTNKNKKIKKSNSPSDKSDKSE